MSTVLDSPDAAMSPSAAQRAHRRRALFLRWLRRIHLYTGLWGAGLGLLFGATGVLMNHRAILEIPIEKAQRSSVQLALPEPGKPALDSPEAMLRWLQAELRFEGLQARSRAEPPRKLPWGERELQQPARWSFNLNSPNRSVSAEYLVGNRFVKVDAQDATALGTLMRLHTATGVTAFWVLLSDSIAGGMIVLSLSGLLMWTRMHPIRLSALGISLVALLAAGAYLWGAVTGV